MQGHTLFNRGALGMSVVGICVITFVVDSGLVTRLAVPKVRSTLVEVRGNPVDPSSGNRVMFDPQQVVGP